MGQSASRPHRICMFIPNVFRWLRSGDEVYLDDANDLFVVQRLKVSVIKRVISPSDTKITRTS